MLREIAHTEIIPNTSLEHFKREYYSIAENNGRMVLSANKLEEMLLLHGTN